jgi:hypothetical protein
VNLVAAHSTYDYNGARCHHVFDPNYRNLFEAFNLQVVSATGWALSAWKINYHKTAHGLFGR